MEITYKDLKITAPVEIHAKQLDQQCLQISCTWDTQDAPELNLEWQQPICDLHFQWHPRCGLDRHIEPDWAGGFTSRIASGAPVICLYNQHGQNRLTAALSDALSESRFRFGVCEETGALFCRINISLAGHNKEELMELIVVGDLPTSEDNITDYFIKLREGTQQETP